MMKSLKQRWSTLPPVVAADADDDDLSGDGVAWVFIHSVFSADSSQY